MDGIARVVVWGFVTGATVCSQPPGHYPAHWWARVEDSQKPAWEVLPQAAQPGEVILSKRNELGILSNFAATPFLAAVVERRRGNDSQDWPDDFSRADQWPREEMW